ncbi:MAG TPA: VOC family protein [Tepidisphaeraceae bacterium]|nr:VOC family protein [Tepidisphaeraceae bacterium]
MLELTGIHHAAIICSDYPASRRFYVEILGLRVIAETWRASRQSWKLDLQLPDGAGIELFAFPNPPLRPTYPEARGLRHLAFRVPDLDAAVAYLKSRQIQVEPIRQDSITSKRFTFFTDPDELPLELYEDR